VVGNSGQLVLCEFLLFVITFSFTAVFFLKLLRITEIIFFELTSQLSSGNDLHAKLLIQ